jgi:uracil-DNA glycosylase family 4
MEPDRLATLVRQHAETARLLGVDFVPAYRSGGDERADEPVPGPDPTPASVVEAKPPATKGSATKPSTSPPPAKVAPGREAHQAALDALRARYERDCPHKDFVTAFNNIVFGEGDPCARLVFIGEAPGEEEDRTGRPFVGRAGQLLSKMIQGMGLSREQVYICNVLKTRPLNNATPTPREVELCSPYLFEQVEIINPEVVVTLGHPATTAVLKCQGTMGSLRARWGNMCLPGGGKVPVMPTYHPAYVLRNYNEETRRKVWSDLKLVMDRLGLQPSSAPATG